MKVYIVQYHKWEDHYISGVFTTKELAKKHIDSIVESGYSNFRRMNFEIIEEELIGE